MVARKFKELEEIKPFKQFKVYFFKFKLNLNLVKCWQPGHLNNLKNLKHLNNLNYISLSLNYMSLKLNCIIS